MKYQIFTIILLSLINNNLAFTMQEPNDQDLTASIQKSRLAAIDFLQPIIHKIEDKTTKSYQDENIITQLKCIQNNIFENLSEVQVSSHALHTTKKSLSASYDWNLLTEAILEYFPAIPLRNHLMQSFNELDEVLQNKHVKRESFLFLVELRDQIKKADLSQIYPASPSQEDQCSHCHNCWTMRTKVLGDAVRECVFCGHDEILSYPKQHTLQPYISGHIVEWLHNLGEDFYVKINLDKTNPLNKKKSRPILFSDVKCLSNYKASFEGVIPQHGVLLDNDSHIEFQIESHKPGPYGFSFAVQINQENIADRLHCIDTERKNQSLTMTVNKHQQTLRTLKLDDFKATPLKNNEDKVRFLQCEINGWRIKSFKKDGIPYPHPESAIVTKPRRESAMITGNNKGDTLQEKHEPAARIRNISDVINDRPIGSLILNFYIFANPEDKGRFYEAYDNFDLSDF